MEWYKVAFGDIYPLVYPHRGDDEATRVARGLSPLLGGRSPVLDVACGNGRYMAAFARTGLDVYGVDLSPYLLADAVAARSLRGRVVLGDMRVLPFRDDSAGAVVNMFTSFGYFETDLDNVRVMHEVARVLAPGGMFLMDFLNAEALGRDLRDAEATRRVERGAVVDERREIVDEGRMLVKHVRVQVEGKETVEYHERLRLYRHEDLVAMAESAGLVRQVVYGDYALAAYDEHTSPRVIMLCEKPGGDA